MNLKTQKPRALRVRSRPLKRLESKRERRGKEKEITGAVGEDTERGAGGDVESEVWSVIIDRIKETTELKKTKIYKKRDW